MRHPSFRNVAWSGLLAPTLLAAACQAPAQTPATWAFEYPANALRDGALLDLRYLNENTAGESGFLKLSPDGNSFLLGNGKPVRFWATVSDGYRLPPDQMEIHAKFLAKMGVNMVRLHTQIAPADGKLTEANQTEIDHIWRYIAALKKNGIYATVSPYWASEKNTTQWGLVPEYTGKTELWGLLFFDEKLQQGYKAWVKALYEPKNPYTGIPLSQDPAVGIVQVQNEDSLFFWTLQALKPQSKTALGRKFATWLTKKYGSLSAAQQRWAGASVTGDDWKNGQVGITPTWELTQEATGATAARTTDQVQFFTEAQFGFYKMIGDYYRKDLGCKQIMNASNWITADPIRLNDLERYTYTALEVQAVNKYYDGGPHIGANNGWRIDPGHFFGDTSALLNPRDLPTNLKQVVGSPMMITESSWVSPLGYQSEGPFAMAAYQSLTGVNTFFWFASGGTPAYETDPYFNFTNFSGGQHSMNKWSCSTPALLGAFPANALLFRRGYVKPGPVVVHEERTLADMYQRKLPLIAEDKSFDPNRNTGNGTEQSNIKGGVNPLAFLVGRVEAKYGGDPAASKVMNISPYVDPANQTVRSATGEINLDYGKGLLTVNSPKAQGVSGFLSRGRLVKLDDVTINSRNEYATIEVVSMDDLPIATSKKLLLQVVTVCRPTGWQQKPANFKSDDGKQSFTGFEVVNTGKMPYQLISTDATIYIKNAKLKKATVLDAAGFAKTTLPLQLAGDKVSLTLPANAMYMILE